MANFKISSWAAMIGLAACWMLIGGGIMGLFYDRQWISIYGIVVGGILIPFFWPFKFLGPLLAIFQQFYVAGAICFALSVITFFEVPTTLGGISLAMAGLVFILSAVKGEKGEYFEKKQ